MVKVSSHGNDFLAQAGDLSEGEKHTFSKNDKVIMFVRPESIFLKDQNNQADNIFTAGFKAPHQGAALRQRLWVSNSPRQNAGFVGRFRAAPGEAEQYASLCNRVSRTSHPCLGMESAMAARVRGGVSNIGWHV